MTTTTNENSQFHLSLTHKKEFNMAKYQLNIKCNIPRVLFYSSTTHFKEIVFYCWWGLSTMTPGENEVDLTKTKMATPLKPDSKLSLEIRTKSVEQTLVPLVTQVRPITIYFFFLMCAFLCNLHQSDYWKCKMNPLLSVSHPPASLQNVDEWLFTQSSCGYMYCRTGYSL